MRYAHFAETCEKCGNKRNMQQSHIRTKLTCQVRAGWGLEFRVRLALGSVTGGRCVGGGRIVVRSARRRWLARSDRSALPGCDCSVACTQPATGCPCQPPLTRIINGSSVLWTRTRFMCARVSHAMSRALVVKLDLSSAQY